MASILSLSLQDRPREKMQAKGSAALTNLELLQVIVGSGVRGADVTQISRQILRMAEARGGKLELEQLLKIRGISTATATKLIASLEFTARLNYSGIKIEGARDALPLLADIRIKKQEHLVVLTIDGGNRLIEKRTVSVGTLNATLMHPREVFADALADRAAGIIVAHNHPGGTLAPSNADLEITTRLWQTGIVIGIELLDHIIVTANEHYSIPMEPAR
jgi:DNA repair protein RadC